MARRDIFIKAALVLLVVWGCVWGIRSYAGARKVTAARLSVAISTARFADWSGEHSPSDAAEAGRREQQLRKIAALVNGLDFNEREKNRENRSGEAFFRKLTASEKGLFIDLTLVESMGRFMQSLDAMKPEQRKKFVEQGLKEISEGRTQEEMAKAEEISSDLLNKITQEGMKAYFEKSNADTKLDLAPLMEAMNEQMQGLRGNEFGPRQ
jgi:DNA-directed RNA polymerase specialized sigma24 family protein